jgi:flagellar biosynthesis/type III secretory pathway chaperone
VEIENLKEELNCIDTEKQLLENKIANMGKDQEISSQKNALLADELDSLKQQITNFQM